MNKPLKYKFPTVLLCFTLVLAILLTGFTEPGFLLPLIGEKQESGKTGIGGVTVSGGADVPAGNSKAFSIKPIEGITISAEENALDKDRDIKLDILSDEEYLDCVDSLDEIISPAETIVGAYELDAGLADDELMPGNIRMSFDLEELGIVQDMYNNVNIYRIDDEGKWYEYAMELDGKNAVTESNQNSIIAVTLVTLVSAFALTTAYNVYDYLKTGSIPMFADGSCKVSLDGKTRFRIVADPETMKAVTEMYTQETGSATEQRAYEKAIDEMRSVHGSSVDKYIKTTKRGKRTFSTKDKELMREFNSINSQWINALQNSDQSYLDAQQKLRDLEDGYTGASADEFYPVAKTVEALTMAYDFLKNEIKVTIPNYVLRVDLTTKLEGSSGVTEYEGSIGNPYCTFNVSTMDYIENLPLTAAHELFHAIERRYVSKGYANFKFDEALAAAVEFEAYDYYEKKCTFNVERRKAMSEIYTYSDFALPMDKCAQFGNVDTSYPDGTYTASKIASCYPMGNFILYLKSGNPELTYSDILTKYGKLWRNGDLSKVLCEVFSITEKQLYNKYHSFVIYKYDEFYRSGIISTSSGYTPETVVDGSKTKVGVSNKEFTVRARRITVEKNKSTDKEYALVLHKDNDFADSVPVMDFVPVSTSGEGEYGELKNGDVFFVVKEFETKSAEYEGLTDVEEVYRYKGIVDWYLLEIIGKGEGKGSSNQGIYTLYPVYAPDTPIVDSRDKKLTITFPDPEKSPSYEIAEGYLIRLYFGNTLEETFAVDFDDLDEKNSFTINLEDLYTDDLKSLWMTASEYLGESKGGDYLSGPETERISLAGGYSGKWVLTDSQSYSEDGLNNSQHVEKRTASGNTFYHYEEECLLSNDGSTYEYRNINESTATFTNLPSSLNPGELFTVISKINVTQSSYNYNGDDVDILIYERAGYHL